MRRGGSFSHGTKARRSPFKVAVRMTSQTKLACKVFRREFMQIGNLDVFLESIIIASACNKFLHIRFP